MIAQLKTTIESPFSPSPYKIEGLIHIFTSIHRDFYTDVIVQALRIAGNGRSVLVVQFLKGGIKQGPNRPVKLGQHCDWLRCDLSRYIDTPNLEAEEIEALQNLWQNTKKIVLEGNYSLVILEDLSLAINFGLIPEDEVIDVLQKRPNHIDIILTGQEMPETILEMADQITQVRRSYSSSRII